MFVKVGLNVIFVDVARCDLASSCRFLQWVHELVDANSVNK